MRNRWKTLRVVICTLAASIALICWLLWPRDRPYSSYATSSFGPDAAKLRFRYPSGWSAEWRSAGFPNQRYIVLRPAPRPPNAILDWIDIHVLRVDPAKEQNSITVNLMRAIPTRTIDDVASYMSHGSIGVTPTGPVLRGSCNLGATLTVDLVYRRPPARNERIVNIFPRDEAQAAHYHVAVITYATQRNRGSVIRIGEDVVSSLELY